MEKCKSLEEAIKKKKVYLNAVDDAVKLQMAFEEALKNEAEDYSPDTRLQALKTRHEYQQALRQVKELKEEYIECLQTVSHQNEKKNNRMKKQIISEDRKDGVPYCNKDEDNGKPGDEVLLRDKRVREIKTCRNNIKEVERRTTTCGGEELVEYDTSSSECLCNRCSVSDVSSTVYQYVEQDEDNCEEFDDYNELSGYKEIRKLHNKRKTTLLRQIMTSDTALNSGQEKCCSESILEQLANEVEELLDTLQLSNLSEIHELMEDFYSDKCGKYEPCCTRSKSETKLSVLYTSDENLVCNSQTNKIYKSRSCISTIEVDQLCQEEPQVTWRKKRRKKKKCKDGMCFPFCKTMCVPVRRKNFYGRYKNELARVLDQSLDSNIRSHKVNSKLYTCKPKKKKRRCSSRLYEEDEPINIPVNVSNPFRQQQKKCLYTGDYRLDGSRYASCYASACEERQNIYEILRVDQLKVLFPVLSRLEKCGVERIIRPLQLYRAVQDSCVRKDFTMDMALKLTREWNNRGGINIDEAIFAIFHTKLYLLLIRQGDERRLKATILRWSKNPNKFAEDEKCNLQFRTPRSLLCAPGQPTCRKKPKKKKQRSTECGTKTTISLTQVRSFL